MKTERGRNVALSRHSGREEKKEKSQAKDEAQECMIVGNKGVGGGEEGTKEETQDKTEDQIPAVRREKKQ